MVDIDDLTSSSLFLSRILLVTIGSFFLVALIWAGVATLDEAVKGGGKVVASSNNKRIQNHEGGFVSEIYVKEGQVVKRVRYSSSWTQSCCNPAILARSLNTATSSQGSLDSRPRPRG